VPFEHGYPIRSLPSRHGQRNFPALWWSATTVVDGSEAITCGLLDEVPLDHAAQSLRGGAA
jgi:hypothetical protein